MATVVLLRGANLGSRRFSPKAVESEMADLYVSSIGAAGTFVVRAAIGREALLARFAKALPFDPRAIVVSDAQLKDAVRQGEKIEVPEDAKRFATAADQPLKERLKQVALPIAVPEGKEWGVRVLAVSGPFALGVRRRVDATGVYPNEIVEEKFKVQATTRDWPTMERILAAI